MPATANVDEAGGALAGRCILIVDDDPDICDAVGMLLKHNGAEVEFAYGGIEALEVLAARGPFDAVVLDLMMPIGNGWDVWESLQANPSQRRTPVIVYTASELKQGELAHARILRKTSSIDQIIEAVRETIDTWPAE